MRPGGRWVHAGSLSSLGCALWIVGFIRGRCVHLFGDRWVHSWSLGSHMCALGALGSCGVVRCTGVPHAGRGVHSGVHGESLGSSLDVVFARVCPGGPLIHPGLLGSLGCSLRVVEFVCGRWFHSGAPWVSLVSSWVVGFTGVRAGVRWNRLRSFD